MIPKNGPIDGSDEIDKAELQREQVEVLERAVQAGVVHMVGESEVVASKGAPWIKRIVINHLYSFLNRNLRQSDKGLDIPQKQMLKRSTKMKNMLEKSNSAKLFLLFATMLGTSMVIGDGVLTPVISVLSAVSGIKTATPGMTGDAIVWISVAILLLLFMVQRLGTDRVGYTFAPVISVWFLFISAIGLYNFIKYDSTVLKALYPKYITEYFKRNGKEAWISLCGVVLSTTGIEALFADVGHFSVRSIQISMCYVVYPSLLIAYTGQASYLRMNNDDVVFVMTLTSDFLAIIMIMIWKTNILLVVAFLVVIGSVELTYSSAVLYKFDQGGYLPLCFALVLIMTMYIWNNVYRRRYNYELENKTSPDKFKKRTVETNLSRLPGLAVFYSELAQGIPPIF